MNTINLNRRYAGLDIRDEWLTLERDRKMIEARYAALKKRIIAGDYADQFTVTKVQSARTYVPLDIIKAHVGQEWYDQNLIPVAPTTKIEPKV